MAEIVFVSVGDRVDYTPGSAVDAGAVVVQADLAGITTSPIAANALGSLAVTGIFRLPKDVGSASALAVGTIVYWDATNEEVTTSAGGGTNKQIGKVAKAAAAADTTVDVRVSQ